MLGPTDRFIHACLNIARNTAPGSGFPFSPFVGYLTAAMTTSDGGGAVELTIAQASDYTRKAVTFTAPASRAMSNNAEVVMQAATAAAWNSGTPISLFGIWDAASAGQLMWCDTIAPAFAVGTAGVKVSILANQLILSGTFR